MKRHSLLIAVIVAGLAFGFALLEIHKGSAESAVVHCTSTHASHKVTIQNDKLSPVHTDAKLCDKLVITNLDSVRREIGIGAHDNHEPYAGVSEKFLNKGENLTLTLSEAGTYYFHDHFHDEVVGSFTITK